MGPFLIKTAQGSLECEELLLQDIDGVGLTANEGPDSLLPAARFLVVPSNSLRDHLVSKILQRRGGAMINFRCLTHFELACEILPPGTSHTNAEQHFLGLYVRRAARRETSLEGPLGRIRDGFGTIIGTVRDLLDAGFHPSHAEALHDVLSEEAQQVATKEETARAHSIIRICQTVSEEFELQALRRPADLIKDATEVILSGSKNLLGQTRVFAYGYADATGLVTDFLLALLRETSGQIYLNSPNSDFLLDREAPSEGARRAPRPRHGKGFQERLEVFGRQLEATSTVVVPQVELFSALGPEAECRGVADHIRELLDHNVLPETIGVLARDLTPYQGPIRRQFNRLGIPFSGIGISGPRSPHGDAIVALQDLLAGREQTRTDRWLDALQQPLDETRVFDLKLAFSTLGAGRLGQVSELNLSDAGIENSFPLPSTLR